MNIPKCVKVVIVTVLISAVVIIGGYFAYLKLTAPKIPAQVDQTAGWKTVVDSGHGIEYKYPADFLPQNQIVVLQNPCNYNSFSDKCPSAKDVLQGSIGFIGIESSFFDNPILAPDKKTYGNNTFCHYSYSTGAAGTRYLNENFGVAKNKVCTFLIIISAYPNCQNYLPLESGNAQQLKNYENCILTNQEKPKVVDQILSTVKFTK